MKDIIIYLLLFAIIFFARCKENQDIDGYDTQNSFVYFAIPNSNQGLSNNELYTDSTAYSFVLEEDSVRSKRLAIPIHVIGTLQNTERRYSYAVNEKETTIDRSLLKFSEPIIHANSLQDSLYITIQRDEVLRNGTYYLSLNIQDNEAFKAGHNYNTKLKISITDQLLEPDWWSSWVDILGPYRREVYRLWMEIYYLGSDPTPVFAGEEGKSGEKVYYWNNMPSWAYEPWYKVTFMYVEKLKKYLEDNPVYPNGDTTKPRIYLP